MPVLHIVGNPFAGSGRAIRVAPKVAAAVREAGWEVEVDLPDSLEALVEIAASVKADAVGVLGGDGTVNAVCSVLPRDVPLLVLPVGTANVVALELGLPLDPVEAARLLADHDVRRWDVGFAFDRPVLFSLSAGIDAEVVRLLALRRKGSLRSKLSYLSPALRAASGFRPRPIELAIDGKPLSRPCYLFLALNTSRYAGDIAVMPQADPSDGVFDLAALASPSLGDHLRFAFAALAGKLDRLDCAVVARFRKLEATSAHPVPVQVDGEYRGTLPVALEVKAAWRSCIVPKRKE